jgi:hypothetical protein
VGWLHWSGRPVVSSPANLRLKSNFVSAAETRSLLFQLSRRVLVGVRAVGVG